MTAHVRVSRRSSTKLLPCHRRPRRVGVHRAGHALCRLAILLLWASLASGLAQAAPPLRVDEVPAPLAPWWSWVLYGETSPDCPWQTAEATRVCAWPGRVALAVDDAGASFELDVEVWGEAEVPLPGREGQWPQDVRVDDAPAVVVARDGVPTLQLAAGRHRLAGRVEWQRAPETLQVPPAYGLLELTLRGQPVPTPRRAAGGELWLASPVAADAQAEADALRLQVYRKLVDELPLQVETLLELDVSGTQRELAFAGAMLADGVPMRLDSPLPARLEADGRLRVQVRPGHWQLRVTSRLPGPVSRLTRPPTDAHWPPDEVWVFDARPALRVVEPTGGTQVDPRQTGLPAEWQALPAFRLAAGESLELVETRRGDPDPAPDRLTLARELWLDFDGKGWTVQDSIGGQLTRGWRLDAGADLAPGRVLLNGEPQFITEFEGKRGVEVRRGALELRADSRIEAAREFGAAGWQHDFDSVTATLHLPPGWRLWSARGVDEVSNTWLERWTLLDLFIVFIVALAVARLWSWPLGALCLVALVLCWHEGGAPRDVWLHLLAAVALVRVLPAGRLATLLAWYRNGALLVLVVMTLAFAIDQIRYGLFPQLDGPNRVDVGAAGIAAPAPAMASAPGVHDMAVERAVPAAPVAESLGKSASIASSYTGRYDVLSIHDPKANVQTGPGLPGWRWREARLGWSGPVTAEQTVSLQLLSPRVNLVLAGLRVVALAWLVALVLRRALGGTGGLRLMPALLLVVAGANVQAADGPDPALLEELKRRAQLPPVCAPGCASVPRLAVQLDASGLQLRLSIHVATRAGVPLPGQLEQGWPATVLIDDERAVAMRRDPQGHLLAALEPGVHEVVLAGAAPQRTGFQLTLPLPAQSTRIRADGWAVDGVDRASGHASQLIFTRLEQAAAADATAAAIADEAPALPPFFTLERRLALGLDWQVHYRLVRVTPAGVGAALVIPLLDGENVTTPGIDIVDGHARVEFGADETERTWSSVLARRERIDLRAPHTTNWVETWRADIAPIWHVTLAGIPLVHHQADDGAWLPTWRPWPGEEASLVVARPAGMGGRTLTVDRSELNVLPGLRATDATLSFTLRSSQGGQHALELPADASLQEVLINDVAQPIRQEGRRVTLPLVPGEQRVALRWRSPTALGTWFTTPAFSLGSPSVNATLTARLPTDRWILLTGGPALGPAVLFWGTLIVVVCASLALGRLGLTPMPTWQWLLLGIGLTQTSVPGAVLVVGWLLALGLRGRVSPALPTWQFNVIQFGLVALTLAALGVLFEAIAEGLLGQPSMQIGGNGSSADELRWFVDRVADAHPQAWVLSVSIWVYRALMLAWALWLAFALLGWLRWGWQHFARDGVWRRFNFFTRKPSAPTAP